MRASSVTDKRCEIGFALTLVQHALDHQTKEVDILAENVLQTALGHLNKEWEKHRVTSKGQLALPLVTSGTRQTGDHGV